MVQDSVISAIVHSKMKITESQRALADMQISKIADLSSDYKLKRRSNEEQFKINKKVLGKLHDCEKNLDCSETDKAKENLAEGTILGITREFSFKSTFKQTRDITSRYTNVCWQRIYGPRREKTCLRGFRQSEFQTNLLSFKD